MMHEIRSTHLGDRQHPNPAIRRILKVPGFVGGVLWRNAESYWRDRLSGTDWVYGVLEGQHVLADGRYTSGVLLQRSPISDGLWRLPGGEVRPVRNPQGALRAEVLQNFGMQVDVPTGPAPLVAGYQHPYGYQANVFHIPVGKFPPRIPASLARVSEWQILPLREVLELKGGVDNLVRVALENLLELQTNEVV
ncbi:NUDIX domain-containing protein [Candidatus Saccharibacteria bacterium]|nr:NUDIX domain-containing protein [Candidatus Saccharibacteria bacterium]